MAGKSVATQADVMLIPGSTIPPGFASGSWAPDPSVVPNPSVQQYTKLTTGNQPVIYEAKGSFLFTGTLSGGGGGTTTEVVDLTASTTVLQKNETNVLRDGDSKTGPVGGNQVKIVSTRVLKSG